MASPFWKYFHDTLRWPLIDKPGPLGAFTQDLAHRLDGVRDDAVFLRDQWFPQRCELGLVPSYGTTRGLVRHHSESQEQFRKRVINAYAWNMLGGKQEGLPKILAFYGFELGEIENLGKYLPSRWAEFQLGLPSLTSPEQQNNMLESLEMLVWLINEYKPARSVLARLYTDEYNIAPLIYSEGKWSEHFYSAFSGVPASDLGDGWQDNDDLQLSFGVRHAFETKKLRHYLGARFFGLARQGFEAAYLDYPVWSHFSYSDSFPGKQGFILQECLAMSGLENRPLPDWNLGSLEQRGIHAEPNPQQLLSASVQHTGFAAPPYHNTGWSQETWKTAGYWNNYRGYLSIKQGA